MTTQETYITDEMRAEVGVEKDRRVSPPVTASDIRKWAIAVYWPEKPPRVFWDEEYAKTTQYGGIIAPEDFNPFAWPIEEPFFTQVRSMFSGGVATEPGTRPLNGGGEAQYSAPIRPGDVITSVSKVVELYERGGRLGRMLFTITENRWTNQKGELVKTYRGTSIRY